MHKIASVMRRTIPNLMVGSMRRGDVGDERNVGKHENDLRKGTSDFVRFQSPQLDSFYRGDLRDASLLLHQTMGSGVVPVDGVVMDSGEVLRLRGEDREKWRNREVAAVRTRVLRRILGWSYKARRGRLRLCTAGNVQDPAARAVLYLGVNLLTYPASGRGGDKDEKVWVNGSGDVSLDIVVSARWRKTKTSTYLPVYIKRIGI
jgi:hypothetical protein